LFVSLSISSALLQESNQDYRLSELPSDTAVADVSWKLTYEFLRFGPGSVHGAGWYEKKKKKKIHPGNSLRYDRSAWSQTTPAPYRQATSRLIASVLDKPSRQIRSLGKDSQTSRPVAVPAQPVPRDLSVELPEMHVDPIPLTPKLVGTGEIHFQSLDRRIRASERVDRMDAATLLGNGDLFESRSPLGSSSITQFLYVERERQIGARRGGGGGGGGGGVWVSLSGSDLPTPRRSIHPHLVSNHTRTLGEAISLP